MSYLLRKLGRNLTGPVQILMIDALKLLLISNMIRVTIQGMPESRLWRDWGQSPRHIAFTITKITSAKFRDPAQTYTARDSPQVLCQLSTSRTP